MAKRKKSSQPKSNAASADQVKPVGLRIIGGKFRGTKLKYEGDRTVRPMKDRVREAVFNLVGPSVKEKHVVDLFAGTGALGLEALSRGATQGTFIERHYPTAAVIRQNIDAIQMASACEVITHDTFFWWKQQHDWQSYNKPIVLFCAPPYILFESHREVLMQMLADAQTHALPESTLVFESDETFAPSFLPDPFNWDVRPYPPALVGIYRVPASGEQADET